MDAATAVMLAATVLSLPTYAYCVIIPCAKIRLGQRALETGVLQRRIRDLEIKANSAAMQLAAHERNIARLTFHATNPTSDTPAPSGAAAGSVDLTAPHKQG